jgi:hypothetical protein
VINYGLSVAYDAKIIKRLAEDLEFIHFFKLTRTPLTAEETRRLDVRDRWYRRRVDRVKRVMAAYHIFGSDVCECDY